MRLFSTWLYTQPGVGVLASTTGRFWTGITLWAIHIFFNAIVTHLIALKTFKCQKGSGLCFLKSHLGSSLDPPRFSIKFWSVGEGKRYPLKSSSDRRTKRFLPLEILIKVCTTGRKCFKVPLRINSLCCLNFNYFFDFNVPFQVTIGGTKTFMGRGKRERSP